MSEAAFAEQLKAFREAAGITQAQLAERSGLHLGAVFKLEQGKREPSWSTVQALCSALGITPNDFMQKPSVRSRKASIEANGQSATAPKETTKKQKAK